MKENTVKISINKSIDEVYNFTINPQNTPLWIDSIVLEEVDSLPIKVGTKYTNQSNEGDINTYFVSKLTPNKIFELVSQDNLYHVRYTYTPLSNTASQLEYFEWVEEGILENPFTETTLKKLKEVMEKS